jgi:hypothetical protein
MLLQQMESVEDLFVVLDVPCDARVVAVHRMRILRRFGSEARAIDDATQAHSEDELKARYREALVMIHEQCARGMRESEPVFRGLAQQLVQLKRRPSNTG